MEPCGTPHVIIVSLDMVPFISVTCVVPVKYDLNHSTVLVSEPIERSLLSKISWLTVSNAFVDLIIIFLHNYLCRDIHVYNHTNESNKCSLKNYL